VATYDARQSDAPPEPAVGRFFCGTGEASRHERAQAPAPANCAGKAPSLTVVGALSLGMAVGAAPVWVGGFSSTYPTLVIGAHDAFFGWIMHYYPPYGWPAPVDLVVSNNASGPVTLTGWDPRDGHALYFTFFAPVSGEPRPVDITPLLVLDPQNPQVPVGDSRTTETFWYGFVFAPHAGCFVLSATWPGGNWQVIISAGRFIPTTAGTP
jgi:hypothetical protein